ncbi:TIGR02099 family protein [Pseudoxanthomonas sp. GM95]|uniref:YhdP family protein n=1 Tax=Pseudoxanthomonas sp. GM95 TaxID=1881043 RepID=UPI0008CC867F|nr:YhdP family protein [Pseudoxanthomonas sp. GM95]SEL79573.1 TIGR02099 family protein [Pseudoxanthomonas sp. GM95]
MPIAFHHRLRVLRRMAWYALAVVLVCVAVVLGVVSQLLPLAERHPDRVAAWLSQQAGRPITFQHLKTEWTRRGPLLQLDGLQVGAANGQGEGLQIGQAEVLVSLYSGLLPGRAFTELRLRNIALEAERAEDGSWAIRGFPGQKTGGDPLKSLDGLGELQLVGGRLHVLAPSLGWDLQLPRIDARLRVQGREVRAGLRLQGSRTDGEPIEAAALFDRQTGDGRAYLEGEGIALADWQALSGLAGMQLRGGQGELHAWARLKAHRLDQIQAELALQQVQLATVDGSASTAFEEVRGRARFQLQADAWRLDVPQLRLGAKGGNQGVDGLTLAGGARSALLVDHLEAAPLLQALAMSNQVKPALRNWLQQAKPHAALSNVQVAGTVQGPLRLSATVDGLAFSPVGHAPGLSGLAGTLSGDEQGMALALNEAAPFKFDWPAGFGVVHNATLHGTLAGWREGAGWKFGTPSLVVDGEDFGVTARGDVWFQNDFTRPWLNVAADVHDTPVPAARGFWVRHLMSKASLDWLDTAMQGGTVRNGTGLVAGDLDDWPFLHNQGLFDAQADIDQGRIRFQNTWPDMTELEAHVRFVNNGFDLSGKGKLGEVPIARISGGIADWHETVLKIDAQGGDDAARLLSLVRHSPLDKAYGSSLKGLSASGPAKVDYTMQLPLRSNSAVPRQIGGHVVLDGAHLVDTTWDLDFTEVRGTASFSDGGFDAPSLSVVRAGQPGQLALRAGDAAQDKANVFEAQLQAPLTSDELLQRVPEITWLQAYLHGRSPWTINVGVGAPPQAGGDPPVRILAQSDLVGTALQLPAPLDKPANRPLAASVAVQLPLDTGKVDVNFGKLMALRAQERAGATGVRVELGRSSIAQPVPASGLSAGGTASALDAAGWIALARASGSAPADTSLVKAGAAGAQLSSPQAAADPSLPPQPPIAPPTGSAPLKLRGIDITAQKLLLIGGAFPSTRVQVTPAQAALEVKLDGDALSGNVHVPDDENAPVQGQLARLYWVSATPPPADGAPAPLPAPAKGSTPLEDDLDPSALPPLALDVDDLRFGEAKLGDTTLRTRKVPGGLHIDTLQMRSAQQKIDVTGDWTGRGASARTHLLAKVDSQDLGALMDGLGFTGRVRGGTGKVDLDLAWPSSPAGFSLAGLEGSAKLDAHNGALLEVEPGAGRVLGLFSLTQLPRRLMLDFRDFFSKGLAFNRIGGDVAFTGGHAQTDNTVIEGPAAEIRIDGSTDLKAQTFDQTIHVLPRSGNLLTVVGAVAGGPVGAAVGAAANAVLRKPLGEIGAKTYHVTGPWKDPKVDVTEHEEPEAAAPAPSPQSTTPATPAPPR